jgi:hypothetical protein
VLRSSAQGHPAFPGGYRLGPIPARKTGLLAHKFSCGRSEQAAGKRKVQPNQAALPVNASIRIGRKATRPGNARLRAKSHLRWLSGRGVTRAGRSPAPYAAREGAAAGLGPSLPACQPTGRRGRGGSGSRAVCVLPHWRAATGWAKRGRAVGLDCVVMQQADGGEHQARHPRHPRADIPADRQPVPIGQPHIENRHVRAERRDAGKRRGRCPGLADDHDARVGLQQVADPRRTISWSSSKNTAIGFAASPRRSPSPAGLFTVTLTLSVAAQGRVPSMTLGCRPALRYGSKVPALGPDGTDTGVVRP